jgi:hypothetical protein
MSKITDIVRKTDSNFDLGATLQKLGFPEDEEIVITFKSQGKEVKTKPLAFASRNQSSSLKAQDLNAVVLEWLNQAEEQYQLSSEIKQELALPKEGDVKITVQITSKSHEFALSGANFYKPCPRPPFNPKGCWI